MSHEEERRDLFVLVADQDMIETIKTLLDRPESLDISPIKYGVDKHLQRDVGCRKDASRRLRPYIRHYRYALVLFDKHGSGQDDELREEIQCEVEKDLSRNGWENRSKAIVIDPELEAWVWSASNHVPRILGWDNNYKALKSWLSSLDLWPADVAKPPNPKEAMKAAVREKNHQISAALFGQLAESVTLRGCVDPAFSELRETLQLGFLQNDNNEEKPSPVKQFCLDCYVELM